MAVRPQPGDVVLTRSKGWVGVLIRFGAALLDRPNLHNHVVIVHHEDASGTLWGVEGKPGGVGWVDMRRVMQSPWLLTNVAQPKTLAQREAVCEAVVAAVQTPYDWSAIGRAAMEALRMDRLWRAEEFTEDGTVPGHVICSALADWAYERAGVDSPGGVTRTRYTTPADWEEFIIMRGFVTPQ